MKFGEKLFQIKLLSRLSHKVCRLLSSPVLLRKFTNVSQIFKGYNEVGFRLDSRLPITLPILDRLVSIAPSLQSQFQAMCSLAIYAFLRIGEMTAKFNSNANPSPSVISPQQN